MANMMESIVIKAIKAAKKSKPIPSVVEKGNKKSKYVKDFQKELADSLKEKLKSSDVKTEKRIFKDLSEPEYKQIGDRADVYAVCNGYEIIIEIDATRADQVAKKMVSRVGYHLLNRNTNAKKLIYVSLLYHGTDSMNEKECEKFFAFENLIITKIDKDASFIGYIMNEEQDYEYVPRLKNSFTLDKTIEKLQIDSYTDYVKDNHPDNSAYQYLRAISIVRDYIEKNKSDDVKHSIEKCIENLHSELISGKRKKSTINNELTYLKAYLRWLDKVDSE